MLKQGRGRVNRPCRFLRLYYRAMNRILLLRTGSTAPEVRLTYGDYDRWFVDALAPHELEFDLCDVTREPIPPASGYIGVIVTGATSSACRPEPWMERLAPLLRDAESADPPVLAVCLGAQMLAQARGGRVVRNPEGWEIGGVSIRLTLDGRSDPLFEGISSQPKVLATHEDRIESLPEGAVPLAGNASSPVQAFRIAGAAWGVQFHPEITSAILEILIRLRADALERDAAAHGRPVEGHVERLLSSLHDPGQGRLVLDNFVALCRRRGGVTLAPR